MPAALPAISAHRGGREAAPAGTLAAFKAAVDSGAEYVEFDVRRTADGTWVIHHDSHSGERRRPVAELRYDELCAEAGAAVPRATEVMELVAGRARGHVDLKCSGNEREIVGAGIDILGADGFVATTEDPASIASVKAFEPAVRTALSVSRAVRRSRQFDAGWIRGTGTDWIALNHRIASRDALRQCRRSGLGVMLWTVNDSAAIAQHLTGGQVEVLITDRPLYATRVRARVADIAVGGATCRPPVPSNR